MLMTDGDHCRHAVPRIGLYRRAKLHEPSYTVVFSLPPSSSLSLHQLFFPSPYISISLSISPSISFSPSPFLSLSLFYFYSSIDRPRHLIAAHCTTDRKRKKSKRERDKNNKNKNYTRMRIIYRTLEFDLLDAVNRIRDSNLIPDQFKIKIKTFR